MIKKLGRNDHCWCGSGKKYNACHEAFDDKLRYLDDIGHIVPSHKLIKTPEQIEKIKESARINVACLDAVAAAIHAVSYTHLVIFSCRIKISGNYQ